MCKFEIVCVGHDHRLGKGRGEQIGSGRSIGKLRVGQKTLNHRHDTGEKRFAYMRCCGHALTHVACAASSPPNSVCSSAFSSQAFSTISADMASIHEIRTVQLKDRK